MDYIHQRNTAIKRMIAFIETILKSARTMKPEDVEWYTIKLFELENKIDREVI
jgi:hypothetical protein